LAISLCATTERTWSVRGPDILTATQTLATYLNEPVPDRLFERVDAALLLFVAFEPVRNIRNNLPMPGRPETVTIETLVEGTEVVIRQTTFEFSDGRPSDIASTSSAQINQVLANVMGEEGPFAVIDPKVRVTDYQQEAEECGRVVRETRI